MLTTEALLVRRTPFREADLVVELFTRDLGRISALARAAQKSRRRFGGSLEPMHTLSVSVLEGRGELFTLQESKLASARFRLTGDLDAMTTAGRALGWLRRSTPPKHPEPAAWAAIITLLDELDDPGRARAPELGLAEFGLALLGAVGLGLELERCVACSRPCAPDQAALIDPKRGGLVCRACGGGRIKLSAAARARLGRAAAAERPALIAEDASVALEIVEQALRQHAGVDA